MKRLASALAATAGLSLALATNAPAQGFGVFEHGTCTMGRAGTGVASPCSDGSAIFFNPAGLAGLSGITLTAGVTGIKAVGDFTDDRTGTENDLQNDVIPVPHLFAAYGRGKLGLGLGVFVPYGLSTEWSTTFEGRFNGYDNTLQSIYIQPTVAYQIHDRVRIGAGLDIILSSIELNQRLDLSEQEVAPGLTFGNLGIPFHTEFADARLDSDNQTGVGANFGVIVDATDKISFGARYLLRSTIDYEGDATFTQVPTGLTVPADLPLGGTVVSAGTPVDGLLQQQGIFTSVLVDQGVTSEITMPDQFVVGVAVKAIPTLTLLADYQWTHWELFDTLPIGFESLPSQVVAEDYENTSGVRFGVDWNPPGRFVLRGGYLYHEGAAPPQTVTPLLPEGDRGEFTFGLGVSLAPMLTADVAYQYIKQEKRRGRVRELPEDAPAGSDPVSLNSGLYQFNAHLVGVTFTLRLP